MQYQTAIAVGGVDAVGAVYADLYAKGYNYAGWAEGVAKGNTVTGLAALNYMQESHFAENGRMLSSVQVDQIRMDMARRTLDEYIKISHKNNGILTRDLEYKEVKEIHRDTFENNQLSLDNWTLNTPMELMRERFGDEFVDNMWLGILETGGDGPDAIWVSACY